MLGVQEIKDGAGDSSRIMSASYLTAGPNALSLGKHIVKVYMQAFGDFKNYFIS